MGALVGLLIAALSLGTVGPLGFVVFGLSVVFVGIWLMTPCSFKHSQVLAVSLNLTPIIFIYVSAIQLWLMI